MTLLKKLLIGWLGLCLVMGSWALITGNTSEEAALQNELADICEDGIEKYEGQLIFDFKTLGFNAKLTLDVEYDDDIPVRIETKRGMNRELYVSCHQKLTSNHDKLEPWALIVAKVNKGDISYELANYDVYEIDEQAWWSEL